MYTVKFSVSLVESLFKREWFISLFSTVCQKAGEAEDRRTTDSVRSRAPMPPLWLLKEICLFQSRRKQIQSKFLNLNLLVADFISPGLLRLLRYCVLLIFLSHFFYFFLKFGDSQKLRLVRILRSTVMVRVGGGWETLDEFLMKNDPCRGRCGFIQLVLNSLPISFAAVLYFAACDRHYL